MILFCLFLYLSSGCDHGNFRTLPTLKLFLIVSLTAPTNMPTLSGFDPLSGFSRTEQPIREEKWGGLSQNLLLVTSLPTF